MKIPNEVYDVLKYIAIIAIPALLSLYGVIGATCHIPYTQEVLTIGAAVDTCLGALLGISTYNYNKEGE